MVQRNELAEGVVFVPLAGAVVLDHVADGVQYQGSEDNETDCQKDSDDSLAGLFGTLVATNQELEASECQCDDAAGNNDSTHDVVDLFCQAGEGTLDGGSDVRIGNFGVFTESDGGVGEHDHAYEGEDAQAQGQKLEQLLVGTSCDSHKEILLSKIEKMQRCKMPAYRAGLQVGFVGLSHFSLPASFLTDTEKCEMRWRWVLRKTAVPEDGAEMEIIC